MIEKIKIKREKLLKDLGLLRQQYGLLGQKITMTEGAVAILNELIKEGEDDSDCKEQNANPKRTKKK
jgi:hypothetical protein